MSLFYSAKNNCWYAPELVADYEAAGTWPIDAREYPREVYDAVVTHRPADKIMVADKDGTPVLVDAPTPVVTKLALLAAAAERRYALETAGTQWGGIPVLTDRDARGVLTSAIVTGELLGSWPDGWKFADGKFRAVTPADLKAVALTVKAHVDAAYAAEAQHAAAIAALKDQAAIDAYDVHAGWPA